MAPRGRAGSRLGHRGARALAGGRVGRAADHPRARRAARGAGAVLAPLAGPDPRLRSGWDVDRGRRRVDASPRSLVAGQLVAARAVRRGRIGRPAGRGRPSRHDPLGARATGGQRSALVLAERLPGRVPVGGDGPGGRRRRDRRSVARHRGRARRAGVAARRRRRSVRAGVRDRERPRGPARREHGTGAVVGGAGARAARADVVRRWLAPARAFPSAGKNVRGRRRGDLHNRAPCAPRATARCHPTAVRSRSSSATARSSSGEGARYGRRSPVPASQRSAGRPTAVG